MTVVKKFNSGKSRYITQGVLIEIPLEYQILMWNYIEELGEQLKLDYLQVFNFSEVKVSNSNSTQKMIHKQEVPEYQKEYVVNMKDVEVITTKVFVIDDGKHCTMLLANEY